MNALVHSRTWLLLGWTMIHFLWIGVLLLVAAGALRLLLRRASPNIRYAVALLALVALAAAPAVVATIVAPRSLAVFEAMPAAVPDAMLEARTVQAGGLSEARPALHSPKPIVAAAADPALDLATVSAIARRAGRLGADYLPWLWIAGFPFTAIYLLAGISGAGRLRRRASIATEPALLAVLDRLAGELGVRGRAVIGLSVQVVAPIVVGFARPMILLPPVLLASWNPDELELILLHELAHVRRWDNLINLFQRVVEAVLFFHPAVWIVSRWVRLEREQCCDEIVLAHRDAPQKYAETLAALAVPGISPVHAAAAMANHQLVARIRNILNVEDRTMRFSTRSLLAVIGSIGLLATLLFIAGPLAADDQQKPAGSPPPSSNVKSERSDHQAALGAEGNSDINSGYQTQLLGANRILASAADGNVRKADLARQKRAWDYDQACGPPDTTQPGDYATAWASATPDGQREWLDVMFGGKIDGVALVVYENNAPGAIDCLWLLDEQGKTTGKHDVKDPTPTTASSGVSIFPLVAATHGVRIELDSEHVPGWNEIDAVGLLDKKGEIHWAKSAKGSSTYADVLDQGQVYPVQDLAIPVQDLYVTKFLFDSNAPQSTVAIDQAFQSDPEIRKLRSQIQELEQATRFTAITGDANQQELAKKRARRAQVRLSLLNEELEDRLAQLREQRAAAQTQDLQEKKVEEQTRIAAQQALAAEAQARANADQVEAARATAQAQLQAANENNRRLQDELVALKEQAEELRAVKERAEVRLDHADLAKPDTRERAENIVRHRLGDRAELGLEVETLANAKQRLVDVATRLGTELKELDSQAKRTDPFTPAEVLTTAKKLREELGQIAVTIKQLDKSLEDESTRAVARQDSMRNKAAAAAREDREALERIERLEKAVQELRHSQQGQQPRQSSPQQ